MGISQKDFAFSLIVKNEEWDVYRFTKDGKKGTLAFTKRDGSFVLGLFKAVTLNEDAVRLSLEETHN